MTTKRRIAAVLAFFLFTPVVLRAQVVKTAIHEGGWVADFYVRAGGTRKPGVLFLGGSEGGRPRTPFADLMASNGYPTLAVAYFKEVGLPGSLARIPLEYFDKPIAWMQTNQAVSPGGVVVVGASRGAELALVLASVRPEIRGVIALAPSSVVWNGMPEEPPMVVCSSWSLGSKPVPFMPADLHRDLGKEISLGGLPVLYKFFQEELGKQELVAKAAIEVERIHGPVLLASGHDDAIWPAEAMGDAVCARLKGKGFRYKYEHLKYPGAGHTLSETLMIGGTVEGNRRARVDVAEKVLAFLKALDSK
jgi:uncharacterized protein